MSSILGHSTELFDVIDVEFHHDEEQVLVPPLETLGLVWSLYGAPREDAYGLDTLEAVDWKRQENGNRVVLARLWASRGTFVVGGTRNICVHRVSIPTAAF